MSKTNAARRRARAGGRKLPPIPDMSRTYEQPGMVNGYVCPQKHVVYVAVADAGVTPGLLSCRHTEVRGNPPVTVECGLMAGSMFYRNVPAEVEVTHEWYRPDDTERRRLDAYAAQHVNAGGLLLRALEEPRVVKPTNAKEVNVDG